MAEKWIKFTDATTDIHWVPVRNINAMMIADADDVLLYFRNYTEATPSGATDRTVTDHLITITDTANAATLADNLANFMCDPHVRSSNLLEIKASGSGISNTVDTVAFAVGT